MKTTSQLLDKKTYENTHKELTFKDLFNPKWYIHQLSGWTRLSYILLVIGLIIIISSSFIFNKKPINSDTYWTFAAASLGFTTALAITNARPLNGVFGIVSSSIYIIMALNAHNPADAVLQGIYVILLDIPVLLIPSWASNVEEKIRFIHETKKRGEKFTPMFWYFTIGLLGILSFIVAYYIETTIVHTPRPLSDSFVLGSGLIGALLTTFRFGEAFGAWLIQGVAQVVLWWITAQSGQTDWTICLTYSMYVANDLIAIFQSSWFHHKSATQQIMDNLKITNQKSISKTIQ